MWKNAVMYLHIPKLLDEVRLGVLQRSNPVKKWHLLKWEIRRENIVNFTSGINQVGNFYDFFWG